MKRKPLHAHTPTTGICMILRNLQKYGSLSNRRIMDDYGICYRTIQRYVESMSLAGYEVSMKNGIIVYNETD